jgi:hypothetical protein
MIMKSRALAVLILFLLSKALLPLAVCAEPDGFRGIKWGTNFKSLTNMDYIRTQDSSGIMYYARGGDELKKGGAILNKIEYGFINDKFVDVAIEATGKSNCKALKDQSIEEFGNPAEEFHGKMFKWIGEMQISVYLEKPDGMSCLLRIGSTPSAQENPAVKEQKEQRPKD